MKPSQSNLQFDNAYQEVNLYDRSRTKPLLSRSSGPNHLSSLFSHSRAHAFHHQDQHEELQLNAQPLYVGEVDHNIEEIGLMAVRQVRYVDDEEWEALLREQRKYAEAMKRQTLEGLRQSRKAHASKRTRNSKGQFIHKKGEEEGEEGGKDEKTKTRKSKKGKKIIRKSRSQQQKSKGQEQVYEERDDE